MYAVTFTNNYGTFSVVIKDALSHEEAIQKAIALPYIKAYHTIQATFIIKDDEE